MMLGLGVGIDKTKCTAAVQSRSPTHTMAKHELSAEILNIKKEQSSEKAEGSTSDTVPTISFEPAEHVLQIIPTPVASTSGTQEVTAPSNNTVKSEVS